MPQNTSAQFPIALSNITECHSTYQADAFVKEGWLLLHVATNGDVLLYILGLPAE